MRTLKSLLIDFERIYALIERENFDKSVLDKLLFSFGRMLFEAKGSTVSRKPIEKDLPQDKDLAHAIRESLQAENIGPIERWIREGIWDEKSILQHLNERYRETNPTDEWKLLNWTIWELNDDIFGKAFPNVLKMSYDGELTCGQLMRFIKRISIFRGMGILEEYNIDYEKIECGLNKRLSKIVDGTIHESRLNTFVTPEETASLSPVEKSLYSKAYQIGEYTIDGILRKHTFINLMLQGSDLEMSQLMHQAYISFDTKMMEAVYQRYIICNTAEKRSLCRILKSIILDRPSKEEVHLVRESITNLQTLKNKIEEYRDNTNNVFTAIIDNSCIEVISQKISDLEKGQTAPVESRLPE